MAINIVCISTHWNSTEWRPPKDDCLYYCRRIRICASHWIDEPRRLGLQSIWLPTNLSDSADKGYLDGTQSIRQWYLLNQWCSLICIFWVLNDECSCRANQESSLIFQLSNRDWQCLLQLVTLPSIQMNEYFHCIAVFSN